LRGKLHSGNGADNNRGIFSLQKTNAYTHVIFAVREKFDEKIDWKRLTVRYKTEGGNLILEGSVYNGAYTKK
jgi:hypothetical protein